MNFVRQYHVLGYYSHTVACRTAELCVGRFSLTTEDIMMVDRNNGIKLYYHLQAVHTSPNYIKLGTFPDEPLPPGIENSSTWSKRKSNGIIIFYHQVGKL